MKNIAIVGTGGFAKEVEWLVRRINAINPTWNIIGFIDKERNKQGVIGDDNFVLNINTELYLLIAIGDSTIRSRLYEKYKKNSHVKFASVIDPSVIVSENVMIGEGAIICAGTIMTVDITIGNCCIINLDCTIGHDAVLEDFVTLNPSVNVSGNVRLCRKCNVGTGTHIIQGIEIGENTIIGAGTVVNRNVQPNCTAVGVPVKVIKSF